MQLNKLKSRIKDGTKVTLNLLSNVIGDSNDEANLPHKFLLTDTQVSSLRKAFAYNSSANIKLSKTKLSKMLQFGGFLDPLSLLFNPKQILKYDNKCDNKIIYKVN